MADNNVPAPIARMIEEIGLFIPHDADPDEQEVYERGKAGRCMTCGGELGLQTMLVLNGLGVIQIVCSGPCLTDMQVLGWVQEQHEDLVQKIKFRGGEGGN